MIYSLAPMEGITGFIIRNAYAHTFKGIDKFYTPFIPAAKRMNYKIIRDIEPANNNGITLIPQLISNDADEVIDMQRQLQEYGYHEININLGCPSGTVVHKKRGSGLLLYPEELDLFLDQLFMKADFPISLKTRIGYHDVEEWDKLLAIYEKYPASELIIHPRIRDDIYKNVPRLDQYAKAVNAFSNKDVPLVYNGDIRDKESYDKLMDLFPDTREIMIGRGLLSNPALCEELIYGSVHEKQHRLQAFHDEVLTGYSSYMSGDRDVLMHMKQLWTFLIDSFIDAEKMGKKIKKSQSLQEYQILIDQLFHNYQVI